MGCACRKNGAAQREAIRRTSLPRIPTRVINDTTRPNDLVSFAAPATPDPNTLTNERLRIEKLRRDAVRRSLGMG